MSKRKLYIRDLTYQENTPLNPLVWANASFISEMLDEMLSEMLSEMPVEMLDEMLDEILDQMLNEFVLIFKVMWQ